MSSDIKVLKNEGEFTHEIANTMEIKQINAKSF